MQKIEWEYIEDKCFWKGSTTGLFSHRTIVIQATHVADEYTVFLDHKGAEPIVCYGLDAAKDKAQSLLNNYVLANILP